MDSAEDSQSVDKPETPRTPADDEALLLDLDSPVADLVIPTPRRRPSRRRYILLWVVCVVMYFLLVASYPYSEHSSGTLVVMMIVMATFSSLMGVLLILGMQCFNSDYHSKSVFGIIETVALTFLLLSGLITMLVYPLVGLLLILIAMCVSAWVFMTYRENEPAVNFSIVFLELVGELISSSKRLMWSLMFFASMHVGM